MPVALKTALHRIIFVGECKLGLGNRAPFYLSLCDSESTLSQFSFL
jgi:hypothetical protein